MQDPITEVLDKSVKSLSTGFDNYLKPVINEPYIKIIIVYITLVSIALSVEELPEKLKIILIQPIIYSLLIFLSIFVLSNKLETAVTITIGIIIFYYIFSPLSESFTNYIYTHNLKDNIVTTGFTNTLLKN